MAALLLLFLAIIHTVVCQEYKIESLRVDSQVGMLSAPSTLTCVAAPNSTILWWEKEGVNVTADVRVGMKRSENVSGAVLALHWSTTHPKDIGLYTCRAVLAENREIASSVDYLLNVTLVGRVIHKADARAGEGANVSLLCDIQGFPLHGVSWRIAKSGLSELLPQNVITRQINESHVSTQLQFHQVRHYENGTYLCLAEGPDGPFNATAHLYVLNKPNVTIDVVKAVGAHTLYVNWTSSDGNEPIKMFLLQTRKNGTNEWVHYPHAIGGGNSSLLIQNLETEVAYQVSLKAKNAVGESASAVHDWVQTLADDPEFVPEVTVKGTTSDSVSIDWTQPRPDVRDFVHFYNIILQNNETTKETVHSAASMNLYMFTGLKAMTTYLIKISACSEYTRECGAWSREVNGTTLEGIPEPPENVTVTCRFDNISQFSSVLATWKPPRHAFGTIAQYKVVLLGDAHYRNESGIVDLYTYGPDAKTALGTNARFENVRPNTNYTVKVAVMTKQRHVGKDAVKTCTMPPTTPDRDKLARFFWTKVESDQRWLLRLSMQRVSERNGVIQCYIVYVIRLRPGQRTTDLPPPEDIPISTYEAVHRAGEGGAYVADAIDTERWVPEVFLGDDRIVAGRDSPCLGLMAQRALLTTTTTTTTTAAPRTTTQPPIAEIYGLTSPTESIEEEQLSTLANNALDDVGVEREARSADTTPLIAPLTAHDGALDAGSNYTGFLELIILGDNGSMLPAYSGYLLWVTPGPVALDNSQLSVAPELTIVLHVLIALIVLAVILLFVLFILHNYTKSVAEEQGIDMNFSNTLMHLCRNVGGRHVPVSSSPPDLPPIGKTDLPAAVAERHRDSDYGFQHEFEMLPDRFPDRTTRSSEARENIYKNRYPDIKAYDQTRVRLSLIDNTAGSDYINANYVIGYKERKKFICAQGPMDNTVNDFWRLVWEQHLEMVLMLTNLEEYSKTKCAQYWPDAGAGSRRFGELEVTHVRENRFADYLVRELKLKMGDGGEERRVIQYHYLVWKDFMAPDNPAGILKFIRRVNDQYSLDKGPLLVHCSAGVGRTGTLVALDSLLQQLREENHVAIFNTVCDLRHQRNFLVQSLKQYIFIYRALLEVSQTGDTEIKIASLKSHIEKMRARENGKDRCPLEDEFDKLLLLVDDRIKTSAVASSEENKSKNRNSEVSMSIIVKWYEFENSFPVTTV